MESEPETRDTTTVPIGLHAVPLMVALNVPLVRKPPRVGSTVDVPDEPQADDASIIAKTLSNGNRRMAHLGVEGIGGSNMRGFFERTIVELAARCRSLGTGLEPVPAGLTIIRIVSVLSMPRSDYGGEKTVGRQEEKLEQEKVWKGREQTRRERDASSQERNAQERQGW